MWGRKSRDRLAAIEQALEGIAATLVKHADSLDVKTPGGLSAVAADARDAKTAAESAFVAGQTVASALASRPGLGELAGAVAANTEAVRGVPAAVTKALQ